MALIHISADMKATNGLLERIAIALERICTRGLNIPLVDPEVAPEPKRIDEDLVYTTDEDQIRREMEKAMKVAKGQGDPEDEVLTDV